MQKKKKYQCCICKKILEDHKPIRLVKQEYGIGNYSQYSYVEKYDFCKKCYGVFNAWINKHKKKEDQ